VRRPELILSVRDNASHEASGRIRRRSRCRRLRAHNAPGMGAGRTKVLTEDDQGQLCADGGAATVGHVGMATSPMEVRDEERNRRRTGRFAIR
jgi:hypothetical protein